MIAIAVLFLLPAYYLAKSKGYNVVAVLVASGVLSMGVPLALSLLTDSQPLPLLNIAFPALALFIVWILPTKEGAPGRKYLKITFTCPECKQEVVFARRYEGKTELCPKCGEIVTVPLDELSPPEQPPDRGRPEATSGAVCYASFGDEMLAAQMQALFASHGIDSEIISGTGGGMLPQLSGTQGFKVAIAVNDWDKAIAIEKLSAEAGQPC